MLEIKDEGRELHISRPRLVGLAIAVLAAPIYLVLATYHHGTLGIFAWFAVCVLLTIAYLKRNWLKDWARGVSHPSRAKTDG